MVIGSVIARLGSKRLRYKNLLPFRGVPLVRMGVLKLIEADSVDHIVLSTDSELIARQVQDLKVELLHRPNSLAGDDVPSIPVFQHIVENFPCDLHVNYNINFPLCEVSVIERAIALLKSGKEEVLSDPFAVWGQSRDCLDSYGDPWEITAEKFSDGRAGAPDVHTEEDLIESHEKAERFRGWIR